MSISHQNVQKIPDDIRMLCCGSVERIHKFLDEINTINPSIQFTMTHTFLNPDMKSNCNCEKISSLAFLYIYLSIRNEQVEVDLYRKPTDRNQYLLTSSCHPAHVTTNIPFSLALRICTQPQMRDKRLEEFNDMRSVINETT